MQLEIKKSSGIRTFCSGTADNGADIGAKTRLCSSPGLRTCWICRLAATITKVRRLKIRRWKLISSCSRTAPNVWDAQVTHQLRRKPFSYQVNRKRIQRLARRFDLLRPEKRQKTRTTDSQHPYPRYENWSRPWKLTIQIRFGSVISPTSA